MLVLFWSIINISLFLFFIFICFKAVKLLREQLGRFAALVFVAGLLSFVSSNSGNKVTSEAKAQRSVSTTAFEDLTSGLVLLTTYNISEDQSISEVDNRIFATGLRAGTEWQLIQATTKQIGNTLEYHLICTRKWSLLGWNIYTEQIHLRGQTSQLK